MPFGKLVDGGVNAQNDFVTLVISGPLNLEVGQEGTYTAEIKYNGTMAVNSYTWYTNGKPIGKGGKSGIVGGIKNDTQTFSQEPIVVKSPYRTNSMTFKWGDNDICYDNVTVKVEYFNTHGARSTIEKGLLVDLKCVLPPKIEGLNPVNLCCADTIEYCDNSPSNQNDWVWKITGDGADSVIYGDGDTSGQGKKCIKVAVYPSEDFTISTLARRKSWKTQTYTRKDSILVKRNQPSTSAISSSSSYKGNLLACRGAVTTLCVEPVCGMSGVNWDLGGAFDIVGGSGTECIQVVPRTNYPGSDGSGPPIPDGAVINITAQVIMNGGCSTNVSSQSIKILSPEIPPKPSGYVAVNLIDDPCDGRGGDFELEYVADAPYVNGFMSIDSDGFKIDGFNIVEITYQPGLIAVTVCNINPCTQGREIANCEVFYVELDDPCTALGDPFPGWWREADKGDSDDIEFSTATFKSDKTGLGLDVEIKQVLKTQDVVVFPNPASDVLNIRTSELLTAKVILYNIQGKILVNSKLEKSNNLQLNIPSQLTNGIYFLSIQSKGKTTVKKITIQR